MRNIKSFLANLPAQPGVYQMLNAKREVVYIGKARNLKKRIANYFTKRVTDAKTRLMIEHIDDIDITVTSTENEAVLLECNLIKQSQPRYNVLLRDDKSYPYILITQQHLYPRLDIYRGSRKKKRFVFWSLS